jgi:hypothetical protein
MRPTLQIQLPAATIELTMGLFVVRYRADVVLDLAQAKRVEAARRELLPEADNPVLVLIPSTIALVDQDALVWLSSPQAMEGVPARAVVVPSSIQVLRDRIRWALFRPAIPFRVFRNPQVAKSWVLDSWYEQRLGHEIDAFGPELRTEELD